MAVVELRDRAAIAELCRRNRFRHVYEIGDLDDFFWPHTRFVGWRGEHEVTQVALLYTEPAPPVLLALGESPQADMTSLVDSLLPELPARLYAHLSPPLLDTVAARYDVESHGLHLKLGLATTSCLGNAPAAALGPPDLDEVVAFYERAYPGTWFVPRMLETGRYVGIREQRGARVCRGRPRVLARLGRGGARQRGHGAGVARTGPCDEGLRRPLPRAARGRRRHDRAQRPGRQPARDHRLPEAGVRGGRRVPGSRPHGPGHRGGGRMTSAPLEDYGLVGDLHTAALVSRHGSIDWACFPRFDSGACFAALLGDDENGRFVVRPGGAVRPTGRRYRHRTLILETELATDGGVVRLIDFMPPRHRVPHLVRIVEGVEGRVEMELDLTIRFDYGSIVPWVRNLDGVLHAVAGPDALRLSTPVDLTGRDLHTQATFSVAAGERVPFVLTWFPSTDPPPAAVDAEQALRDTERFWVDWAGTCSDQGRWHEVVLRSLITLKALTYAPTGGIVAAPTTSLPECLGGVRNWDYRYCWLRDATLTLLSFLRAGYDEEARAWRDWLLRAIAGSPEALQIMYGLGGERRLTELELPWLDGYEGSRPVRVGNAAASQLQLDVFGEVGDALYHARLNGLAPLPEAWALNGKLLEWLDTGWREPDEGIWEVRGPRRHFTHSKVMAWVAFDRAVRSVRLFGLEGPVDRWRARRDEIHDEVCRHAWHGGLGAFTQSYGSDRLDASLLMMPLVGFLPAGDERVAGTVAAIERDLVHDCFVSRYRPDEQSTDVDGLPPGEGAFLPCSFWLAEVLALQGRRSEASMLFERLLGLSNDVGLLSEEYDVEAQRLVGNFPQALTHLTLVDAALQLDAGEGALRAPS